MLDEAGAEDEVHGLIPHREARSVGLQRLAAGAQLARDARLDDEVARYDACPLGGEDIGEAAVAATEIEHVGGGQLHLLVSEVLEEQLSLRSLEVTVGLRRLHPPGRRQHQLEQAKTPSRSR